MESKCENLWAENLGGGLGHQPTAYYGVAPDKTANQKIIDQKSLRYKMLIIYINN